MSRKNVLQINANNFGEGGISVVIWRLMEQCNKLDDISFSYTSDKDYVDEKYISAVESQGGRVIPLIYSNGVISRYFSRYKALKRILKDNKFDIVHINGNEALGIIPYVLAAKKSGVKSVVHGHNTRFHKPNLLFIKNITRKLMIPILMKNTDIYLACSTPAAKFMYGKYWKKATIINNGLNLDDYIYSNELRSSIRKQHEVNNKLVIGHIGRFSFQKNHEKLISVFYEIQKINSESELWLIGEKSGDNYDNTLEEIKKYNLEEKVKFIGSTREIRGYLSAIDVYAFPSRFEGLPLVLVEAQANGVPILYSDSITEETVFSDNIESMSIEESDIAWANKIIELAKLEHITMDKDVFRQSKFDICEISKILVDKYQS